jgi:hypothetical protein
MVDFVGTVAILPRFKTSAGRGLELRQVHVVRMYDFSIYWSRLLNQNLKSTMCSAKARRWGGPASYRIRRFGTCTSVTLAGSRLLACVTFLH